MEELFLACIQYRRQFQLDPENLEELYDLGLLKGQPDLNKPALRFFRLQIDTELQTASLRYTLDCILPFSDDEGFFTSSYSEANSPDNLPSTDPNPMPNTIEGQLKGQLSWRVAIVAARFNELVVNKLVGGSLDYLQRSGLSEDKIDVIWVPAPLNCLRSAPAPSNRKI